MVDGRYRLVRSLRAMNPLATTEIFEVESWSDRQIKIMKVLKDSDPQAIEHFEREALALQWLDHPGIPKVELGDKFTVEIPNTHQTLQCLVMEKIEGENLEEWIRQHGPIDQKTAIAWLKQLLEILEIIHENQFFHRDIKPSNIMHRPDGQLVLIDFGSARSLTNTYLASVRSRQVTTSLSMGYTPQEQLDGQAVPQSDFFALGRTFVYLLTGTHPSEIPYKMSDARLLWREKAPQVSTALKDLIDELMALKPSQRPATAADIHRHLSASKLRLTDLKLTLNSRKFKLAATLCLSLGLTIAAGLYGAAYPLLHQHYYNLGLEAQENGRFKDAKQFYEKSLKYKGDDSRIYNNLGLICKFQGEKLCAEEMYKKALEIDQNNPIARYNLGGIYNDMGKLDLAEAQYHLVLPTQHEVSSQALNDLSRLKILSNDFDQAILFASQGLQKELQSNVKSALYKNRGWAYFLKNEYEAALLDLRAAIVLDQDRADAYCLLAQVLEAQSKEADANEQWIHCLKKKPSSNLEVRVWRSMAQQRLS
ncbi:protein kinase domain-containing protein [Trichothermofontia sp.]